MADKRLLCLEAAGAVFIGTAAPVTTGLYGFFDGELIGILFGAEKGRSSTKENGNSLTMCMFHLR